MRIGFFVFRYTSLKIMGPLIEQACLGKHEVVLYFDSQTAAGDKAHQQVDPANLAPFAKLGAKLVGLEAASLGSQHGLDVLFVLEGFHTLQGLLSEVEKLRKAGTKVVSLPNFFEVAHHPIAALDAFDITVYLSDYARQAHFEIAGATESLAAYEARTFAGGSPTFDQLAKLDRKLARQELGLPPDQPVILLMSPVISAITPWRYRFWRRQNFTSRVKNAITDFDIRHPLQNWVRHDWSEIFAQIRALADRSNALLVTKSRGKQPNQAYEVNQSDHYFDGMEDVYYPVFSSYPLMAAADLCITVNSMAAAEAIAVGIPSLNIYAPHLDFSGELSPQDIRYYNEFLGGAPASLMNYPGCVWRVDYREAVRTLKQSSITDYALDPAARSAYISKFLGIKDRPSSERILTRVEALLQ